MIMNSPERTSGPKRIVASPWFVALAISCGLACGGELNEKVDVGDFAPSYASTKCGGVIDGVANGKTTCYTCRSGAEPVFYVFVKSHSQPVFGLLKEINKLVEAKQKQKQKVTGVVNFLGDPKDEKVQAEIRDLGVKLGLMNVALTLTADGSKFDLEPAADVTVIMFENGIIRLRSSAKSEQLDEKTIQLLARRAKALID